MGYVDCALTALLFGLQGAYGKTLAKRLSPAVLAWAMFSFTLPYLLVLLLLEGLPAIEWTPFLWATGASALANTAACTLFFRALREAPLAHTMPFTAFTPVFLIPVAYVLLDELPGQRGLLGVVLIVSGAYGIHMHSAGLFEPFKMLVKNRGTRLALGVALVWSVSAPLDKVGVLASSTILYAATVHVLITAGLLPHLLRNHRARRDVKDNPGRLMLLGLISGGMIVFQFTALNDFLVSYVIAFKRTGVLVSVLLGAAVFGEHRLGRNLLSTAIMLLGVFLLL